jgi:hypothetical protein
MAQYDAPAVVETTAAVAVAAPQYYYADYDNVVVAAKDTVYYTSALTPEAIAREKSSAKASTWSAPADLNLSVENAKGATFCGGATAKEDPTYGGKYKQLFIADEGAAGQPGYVYGWDVVEDPKAPEKIKLAKKWTVYGGEGSQPVDVECGPKDGLFIADKGKNAIYWYTNADLVAKKEDAAQAVVPEECGAVVAEVRSLNYNAETGKLSWSNNDEAVVENAGVFSYAAPADASPAPASCKAENCNAWSSACNSKIKQVEPAVAGEKVWAVADAWGKVQVSKGDANIYDTAKEAPIAKVAQEATYARATNDPSRDVLLVADEKEGEVNAVSQSGSESVVAENVDNAYGVAYNNAWGWNEAAGENSASLLTVASGAVLAAVAMFL